MYDVVAVGELLIDFTPAGTSGRGAALFARNPGGAPANVLAAVTRLGGKTAFIGKVGEDGASGGSSGIPSTALGSTPPGLS